ncbi:MAG: cytochrome c family protein [Acidobacteriota bacterium]|nr:cytochrome c family protein [Acidobacteriota bacterium]MDH3529231.1 cytochrome c family protein [Acidobacteriota bacterium]
MKIRIVFTFLVLFALLGLSLRSNIQTTTAQTGEDRVPPETIVLGENAKLGKITFNHGNHITKKYSVDGTATLKCIECHHVELAASDVPDDAPKTTVYPADRTVTLTLESLKDPDTPNVTTCRSCHISKNDEPKILTEIPEIEDEKGKTISLTNQNAFHRGCTTCHNAVAKARPEAKAPTAMKCTACHKKS